MNALKVYIEQNVTFLMIGPSGSGTSLLLQGVITDIQGCELITINCSSQLTTSHVLYMIKQVSNAKTKETVNNLISLFIALIHLILIPFFLPFFTLECACYIGKSWS